MLVSLVLVLSNSIRDCRYVARKQAAVEAELITLEKAWETAPVRLRMHVVTNCLVVDDWAPLLSLAEGHLVTVQRLLGSRCAARREARFC